MTMDTLYFVYSYHKTRERAEMALESYFAEDIVSPGERPRIEKRGTVWCVLFPG
jgi:hypothetical protein